MGRGVASDEDRRHTLRVSPDHTPWSPSALLRPGREVQLINVSAGGALVASDCRLLPGARTELQLSGCPRVLVPGRVERCRITSLEPLRYEGAIVFDRALEWFQRAVG